MGKKTFENYSLLSKQEINSTEKSGRYPSHVDSEKRILLDVFKKLDLQPEDSVLDIGCGVGLLLFPISFVTNSVTGIDHPDVIDVAEKRLGTHSVKFISGNFLDLHLGKDVYEKILIYSVVQNLADETEVFDFVRKALRYLKPGGKLLLGDIANVSKKERFQTSPFGKEFEKQWRLTEGSKSNADKKYFSRDDQRIEFDDKMVLKLLLEIRALGCDAFIMPQPNDLPWGHTREDIIIQKPV